MKHVHVWWSTVPFFLSVWMERWSSGAQPHMWQTWSRRYESRHSNRVQVTWQRRVSACQNLGASCDAFLYCIIPYERVCVFCSMCVCKTSVRQFENVACRCVKSWSRSCLRPGRQTTRRQTLRCLNSEAHTSHCLSLSISLSHSWHTQTAPSSCRCNKCNNRPTDVLL